MLGKHPTRAFGDLHVAMLAELRVALGLDGAHVWLHVEVDRVR
jgi:hypothetical protein